MLLQDTIKLSGKCLMNGQNSEATIKKNNGQGIRFIGNGEVILARATNVISSSNFVVLGNQNAQFALVEHLMASLAICNVQNVDIELTSKEVPILDGSAKEWVEAIKNSDLPEKSEIVSTEFEKPIYYTNNDTSIVLTPAEEFSITYMVNFEHKDLKNRWVTLNKDTNINEIVEARTFGYLKDLEKLQKMGIGLGADITNTVGLDGDGYTCELRSEFECAKHKILDIIGDLHLTGRNPLGFKANIFVKLAGHTSHVEFAKKIIKELGL